MAAGALRIDWTELEDAPTKAFEREPQPAPTTRSPWPVRQGATVPWIAGLAALCAAVAILLLVLSPGPEVASAEAASPAGGQLLISTQPAAATIDIDGHQRCPLTPCFVAGLPVGGELLVTARAPGHDVWRQRLVLPKRGVLQVTPRLRVTTK